LLFLGTEFGAYVSFDRGGHWTRLKGNLPMVRVDDIQIHPRDNDLVLGTHGRSVWVLDDLTPFEQMSDAVRNADATLFDIQPGIHYRLYNRGSITGHKMFTAPNPPYGAVIHYYLKDKAKDDVKVKITDKNGKTVRELNGPKEAGLNRVVWDLRGAPAVPPEQPGEGGEGGGGFGFGPRGLKAAPGDYTVTISVAGHQLSKTVKVEEDPRIQISDADRAQLTEAQEKVFAMQRATGQARRSLQNLKAQLTTLQDSLKKTPGVSADVNTAVKSVADQVDDLLKRLIGVPASPGNAGPPLPDEPRPLQGRINSLAFGLESYTSAPTQDDGRRIGEASAELKTFIDQVNKLLDESVAGLNKQMRDSGVAFINGGGRITLPQ
jgi:ElaB/YqjD/DUF883 family membrane-anchored ribosome-binding protein